MSNHNEAGSPTRRDEGTPRRMPHSSERGGSHLHERNGSETGMNWRDTKLRWLTMEEFEIFVGNPCERCVNWDMDAEVCQVGRRPRLYYLEDGPNERCHGVKYCMKFVPFEVGETEGMKQAVAMALDCNFQKYC